MEIEQLSMDKEKAKGEYLAYREALKHSKEAYVKDMAVVYGHLSRGHNVIDVWQAFRDTGLDGNGDPKIAVARADRRVIHFRKVNPARSTADKYSGAFLGNPANFSEWSYKPYKEDVTVPAGEFKWALDTQGDPLRSRLETVVPTVPAKFLPKGSLENYYVLWEVDKWDVVTPPSDPLLLRRISPNVFGVLAGWDLSDIEKAVLRGRLG